MIGIVDRATNEIQVSYRSEHDKLLSRDAAPALGRSRVVGRHEKRSLRIDDAMIAAGELPFRPHMIENGSAPSSPCPFW
jgi:hypothetical protein